MRFGMILISFLALGALFYEMSGGSDFDPEAVRLARIEAAKHQSDQDLASNNNANEQIDVAADSVQLVSLNLASFGSESSQDPVQPAESAQTVVDSADTPDEEPALDQQAEGEEPIILPSLILDAPVITRVDFRQDNSASDAPSRRVSASAANVRSGPGTDYLVVGRLTRGDVVEILDDNGGWVRFRTRDRSESGWIAASLLAE